MCTDPRTSLTASANCLLLAPDGNLLAFGHAIDKRYTPTGDSRM